VPSSLGPMEIVAILVVALIVLGPKRLPEAGRQIGKALAEIRRWSHNMQTEIRDVIESEPAPKAATTTATDGASTNRSNNGSAEHPPASGASEPATGRALTD
jgi:sec-independent protein translocase protein TatA